MNQLRVCCGSSSIQRQTILRDFGFSVDLCLPSNIDEHAVLGGIKDPEETVKRITVAKTDECLKQLEKHKGDLDALITGDIVVVDANNNILEKPTSVQDAKRMLRIYNETRQFYAVQALEVTNLKTGQRALDVNWVSGTLKDDLPEEEFDEYLQSSGALNAAGAMIIEHDWFSKRIGCVRGEIVSVRGLSLILLKALLRDVHL